MKELVENIEKQISTDKEVISVLPRNGIRAIKSLLETIKDMTDKYEALNENVLQEIAARYDRLTDVEENVEIHQIEEEILRLNNKFYSYDERCNKVDKIVAKQDTLKKKITDTYLKAQDSLIKGYFDKAFKNISNLEELDNYRKKLDHYGNLIGRTDDYTFFDDYYTEKMSQLEHKSNVLENGGIETALEFKKPDNLFVSWFRAIKNFVTGEKIHN